MIFREATLADIPQLQHIRVSVKENVLYDPSVVPVSDVTHFLAVRGKGWLCATDDVVAGFAIANLQGNNIWALFVMPGYEGKGIGRGLQKIMLDWYFGQTDKTVWLGTAPRTRAEEFYLRSGWKATGMKANGETGFEMSYEHWKTSF